MNDQEFLNRSDDWLKYAIRLNLRNEPESSIADLKSAALKDDRIQSCLADVARLHDRQITNHKDPLLPIHRLLFLLDLGFGMDIPQIKAAVQEILKHRDERGVYQSLINVPQHFGGSGEGRFCWCLCDAPLLLLALLKAGVDYDEFIRPGVNHLASLCRENGFPCAASPELGKFRGPGKKDDCCPYATLIMANLLSYLPEYRDSAAAVASVTALLNLWEHSREQHPYLFYMGTDFRKLKAPSSWYDIVGVADVLSKYEFARNDPRFLEMIALIRSNQDADGYFTPESVYQKLKEWDFGQKKVASPYLTYLCLRIFGRLEQAPC